MINSILTISLSLTTIIDHWLGMYKYNEKYKVHARDYSST